MGIPVIDISAFFDDSNQLAVDLCDQQIGLACRDVGFFYITNHGVSQALQMALETISTEFFNLSKEEKSEILMLNGGKAWRGSFLVGDEVTSGIPDQKEGIYFGRELGPEDPRPLHGPNQWPSGDIGQRMKQIVTEYMRVIENVGQKLIQSIARSIGLSPEEFGDQFLDPTVLFRIFNYPPHDGIWGETSHAVGEHTDYGYITILKQDMCGGLQVKQLNGEWMEATPIENTFVINLGDALEHNTGGLLRATPHRVLQRNGATSNRMSFPFFFDPSFDAVMTPVTHLLSEELQNQAKLNREMNTWGRWDKQDPAVYHGTYGNYLIGKVSKVFPSLYSEVL